MKKKLIILLILLSLWNIYNVFDTYIWISGPHFWDGVVEAKFYTIPSATVLILQIINIILLSRLLINKKQEKQEIDNIIIFFIIVIYIATLLVPIYSYDTSVKNLYDICTGNVMRIIFGIDDLTR